MTTSSDTPVTEPLEWKRAHWLSPLTRAWILLVIFAFSMGRNIFETLQETNWDFRATFYDPDNSFSGFLGPWAPLLMMLAFFVLGFGAYYLEWFFTRYAVSNNAVHLRKGIFFKTNRKANLEKIQSVDIIRGLLPRFLGLSEVRVDTADGDGHALSILYLKHSDANALRTSLLALVREAKQGERLVAGQDDATSADTHRQAQAGESSATYQQEQRISHLPVGRLIASKVLSGSLIFWALILVIWIGGVAWFSDDLVTALFANFAVIFGAVASLWNSINRDFNFRAFHGDEGLKLRYGLTDSVTQSVPTGRIQAIQIRQPVLWRRFGWYAVTANIAGYGIPDPSEGKSGGRTTLLPAATAEELQRLLPLVVLNHERGGISAEQLKAAMDGEGEDQGFTAAPKASRHFDWFSYKRNGFASTEKFLLLRKGFLVRKLTVVPHDRVQSVRLRIGPLASRAGLAEVAFHSVSGPIAPSIKNIADYDAKYLAARY